MKGTKETNCLYSHWRDASMRMVVTDKNHHLKKTEENNNHFNCKWFHHHCSQMKRFQVEKMVLKAVFENKRFCKDIQ